MRNPLDIVYATNNRVCPWWLCFTFDNPIRKLFHDPIKILSPYIQEGFTVVDIGPGMGYFTIPMCRLVGEPGRVIAVDIQQQMLERLNRRALKAGVAAQLSTLLSTAEGFRTDEKADFVLTFWMVHEVPHKEKLFQDIHSLLRPGGQYLLVEPKIHVTEKAFARTIEAAKKAGLREKERPKVALSRAALFQAATD